MEASTFKDRKKRGFTLIELLVVFSIISLLSSIIVSSVQSTQEQARDSRRIEDFRQLRRAVMQFEIDNGFYPGTHPAGSNTDDIGPFNNVRVSEECNNDLRDDLRDSGDLPQMIADPIDDIPPAYPCKNLGNINTQLYVYGWAARTPTAITENGTQYFYPCFTINRFETETARKRMQQATRPETRPDGGSNDVANINEADFWYCFQSNVNN